MSFFLTQNEMLASFLASVNYIAAQTLSASGAVPNLAGLQVLFADTTSGDITLTLPVSPSSRFELLAVNIGSNNLILSGTINGVAGPHTIATQYFGAQIRNNNGAYLALTRSIP